MIGKLSIQLQLIIIIITVEEYSRSDTQEVVTMAFLCHKHRDQLRQLPHFAQSRWEEWMNRGYRAMESGQWSIAIAHFGCCYEISEMLLAMPPADMPEARFHRLDQLMLAGHLLAESLGRDGRPELERHYLLAVHHYLTHPGSPANGSALRKNLEISLLMLRRHCRQHGEFSGFEACLERAEELIGGEVLQLALH